MRYFMILYITDVKKCLTVSFWLDCSTIACLSVCVFVCVCVSTCMQASVCACLPIFHSRWMCHVFYCTLPEINCSPFTVGEGRWYCHSAREGGGVGGRGRCWRKRSGLLLIVAFSAGVKSSLSGSLQEGKQTRHFWDTEQKKRQSCLQNHSFSQVCNGSSQPDWVGLKGTDDSDLCSLPPKPFIMDNESCEVCEFTSLKWEWVLPQSLLRGRIHLN